MDRSSLNVTYRQDRSNEKYSPAILRRKHNGLRRERPKSMPNVNLNDENNNLKMMTSKYDFTDTRIVRPEKEFDLFPNVLGRNTNAKNQKSPRPNKKETIGRGS